MAKKKQIASSDQLPEELRDQYEIVGQWPDAFEVTGLEVSYIHWQKMTVEFAEHLIKIEFKGLRRKNPG